LFDGLGERADRGELALQLAIGLVERRGALAHESLQLATFAPLHEGGCSGQTGHGHGVA